MKIVEVYGARTDWEAHLVRGLLEDAGIKARIVGEMLKGAAGELPLGATIAPRVWVFEKDEAGARAIIEEWEARYLADRARNEPPWACPQCGEAVDATFDLCWKCQTQRP